MMNIDEYKSLLEVCT